MSPRMVVIGPPESLPGMKERLDNGADAHAFTDAETLEALDYIIREAPGIVALDREFSSTSRGAALIQRIKDDPSLHASEVRVLARGTGKHHPAVARSHAAAMPETNAGPAAATLDQRGTRRAVRVAIKDGVEVMVDGNPAMLVDLSRLGAQVLSATVLKPNQRVRTILGDGRAAVRCNGTIAWAWFEMPAGMAPRYRAGVMFLVADSDAVAAFGEKHKK